MDKLHLFDIQPCSFVDGPGIRTTLFFKGCNLHCRWCHNPESQSPGRQLGYFANRCTHCGLCQAVCPSAAVKEDFFPDPQCCTACGICASACPTSARKLYGEDLTIEEAAERVLEDHMFFETSGGGVTCSGGECMLQSDGLFSFLARMKAESIHTAVDTAGQVPWNTFERLLPVTDLWLYDIKCLDAALHKTLTGVGNDLILANYQKLLDTGANVIVRVPVIPGMNDIEEEMEQVAAFLSKNSPQDVEFLPYHAMGESKSAALQRPIAAGIVPDANRIRTLHAMAKGIPFRCTTARDDPKGMIE